MLTGWTIFGTFAAHHTLEVTMLRRIVYTSLVCCALAACGPDSPAKNNGNNGENSAQNNGGNNGDPVATDCQERCEAKAVGCGAPDTQATPFCTTEICSYDPTVSEVECLESGTCEQLTAAFSDPENDLCGIRSTPPSNNGGTNGGTNGGNNSGGNNGESCTPGQAPYCDGDDLVTCEEIAGTPATVRNTCPVRCEDGECIEAWELCEPGFSDGQGCPDECNLSNTITVNGNSYCTSRCGLEGECPTGTECNTDRNNGICLPTCTVASDCPEGFLDFCPESGFCGD
jgi:hypothetical protein